MKSICRLICYILFLLCVNPLLANPISLKWHINTNDRIEIIKTASIKNYINGDLHNIYSERNIIDLTCTSVEKSNYNVDGKFSVFSKHAGESIFKKTQEDLSSFVIQANGHMSVPKKSLMPNLRDIPVFPVGEVEVGQSWKAPGEIVFTNFSVPFSLQMPVSYSLREITNLKGYKLAVIDYSYFINQENKPGTVPADFPIKIIGEDKGVILWDLDRNVPVEYKNRYKIIFIVKNSNGSLSTAEWHMNIDTTHTTYTMVTPSESQKGAGSLKEELKDEGLTVEENEKGIVIRMGEVLFDFDSAKLRPDTVATLQKILAAVKAKYPDRELIVEGHTDNTGNPHYNHELSEKRAKNVASYLLNGLSHDKVSYIGHGESFPIEKNDTSEGRKKNRRVDIIIKLK